MAKKGQTNKAQTETAPQTESVQPQTETAAVPSALLELDEAALLEALRLKREGKRQQIVSEIESLQKQIEERTADLREQILAKQAELRTLGGIVAAPRRNGGGSINVKGATARAILEALSGGPMAVKDMKALPSIAALMEGKYEKSFMAVNLAALRDKGLVEQTAERGVWRLTETGQKLAAEPPSKDGAEQSAAA